MVCRGCDTRLRVWKGRLSRTIYVLIAAIRHQTAIPQVLIFSHISERDGAAILRVISKVLQESAVTIGHLIITTYEERLDGEEDLGRLFYPNLHQYIANNNP